MTGAAGRHVVGVLVAAVLAVMASAARAVADDLDDALREIRDRYQHGDYAGALPRARDYAAAVRVRFGEHNLKLMSAYRNLAELYDSQAVVLEATGQFSNAERSRLDALTVREQALGKDHLDVAMTLSTLGALYLLQRKYDDAQSVLLRALAIREKTLPPDDVDVIAALKQLGDLFAAQGRYQEAAQFHRRVPPPPAPALGAYRAHGEVAFPGQQVLVYFATNRERSEGGRISFDAGMRGEYHIGYAIIDFTRATSPEGAAPGRLSSRNRTRLTGIPGCLYG